MARLLHEIWRADGDCTAITCCLAGPMGDKARAMLEPGAYLLQVFWANSSFEAGTIRNKILGFGPYTSDWEEIDSHPYADEWLRIQESGPGVAPASSKDPALANRRLIDQITAALTVAATKNDTTDAHRLIGELVSTRPADALSVLHRATKRSKKAALAVATLLLERGDAGCAISDEAIVAILNDVKHVAREAVLGSMHGSDRQRFAPQLREIAKHRADPGWAYAVGALGEWRDHAALDSLMSNTCGVDTPFVLVQALVKLRPPEAAVVFEAVLRHPEPRERTFALWGLAALGFAEAVGALIELLDDTDISTATSFTPGQSMRAAQALADVFGLAFEWGEQAEIEKLRRHFRVTYSADLLATLAANLAAGKLTRLGPDGLRFRPTKPTQGSAGHGA